MIKNTEKFGGIIYSQKVLLALVSKGLTREDAYKLVQKNALEAFNNHGDFKANLLKDEEILKNLSNDEIEKLFNEEEFLQNIEKIYERFL